MERPDKRRTMNQKKLPTIGMRMLTGSLMASILFVSGFIAPRAAFAQISGAVSNTPTYNPNTYTNVSPSTGPDSNVPASGFDTPTGGSVNASEILGGSGSAGPSSDLLPPIDGIRPADGVYPTGTGQDVGATNGLLPTTGLDLPPDPIGFKDESNGGFSFNDENGVRQTVGGNSGNSQVGVLGNGTSTAAGGGVRATVGGALQCSAAGVLGNILATSIRSAITNLIGGAIKNVALGVLGLGPVPVDVKGQVADHIVGDVQARTGSFAWKSIFKGVSWDSIAWCIVNSMIEQIANSTIAWANSGFNGSPAFIQNPERFFSDLADQTAGSIIKDIAYGGTGINVCRPFKVNIAIGLAQNYQGQQTPLKGLSCRLSDITSQKFFGGVTTSVGGSRVSTAGRPAGITWDDWVQVTQKDQNNPYGTQIMANQILYAGISTRQNTVQFEVGMNNGWLNFKKCKDQKNPKTCDIVTPGRLIESQLNSTLDQSKQRLVMAQKFDQMITAIVNNLIKVALNKVLSK